MIVLRARAAPFERGFPYGVVRQLFEPVLARGDLPVEELLEGAAAGARSVLGDELRSTVAPDSLFVGLHGLYWLTANLAARAPLLVSVDDVIWCDDASFRYLEFLVRRLEGMGVAMALTYRTGGPQPAESVDVLVLDPLADVVQPGPLTEPALGRMLMDGLREEVAPEFCTACHTSHRDRRESAAGDRAATGVGGGACSPPGNRGGPRGCDWRGRDRSGGEAASGLPRGTRSSGGAGSGDPRRGRSPR